jgi:uroporphyrinogen-III decarboxylase
MTGREKIEAAITPEGSREFAAVIPYEMLCYRDHWDELTPIPWWHRFDPDPDYQFNWYRDMFNGVPQDWMGLPASASKTERGRILIKSQGSKAFQVDQVSGQETEIERPQVGGWSASLAQNHSVIPVDFPRTSADVVRLIPDPVIYDQERACVDGTLDLPKRILSAFPDRLPTGYVVSPLWQCYRIWGFEGLMTQIVDQPELVGLAAERFLSLCLSSLAAQAARGIRVVWIEECFTDLIHPHVFAALNLPLIQRLIDGIHQYGMASVYYYCGDPGQRLEALISSGTDILGLEEGKKGFEIDIVAIAEQVAGRCALLGNLDAIGCLEQQDEKGIRNEIKRQMAAGRCNHSRFIMSLGSPVTPGTSMPKLRRYFEMARELGQN